MTSTTDATPATATSTPAPQEPYALTATELLAAYESGDLSPVEATVSVLDRIESVDPKLNAFCLVDRDEALAQARASEERRRRGEALGLLDGVPTSIKDLMLTKGHPTLRGSLSIAADREWDEDAPCVARMREQGAVFVGKTTTPEFGWKGVTDNPLTGVTRNPWDPSTTAGGSSGGSASAVAAGMAPLSIGTDGGGSVRIPAAFCGIFGMKPTYGRIPLYPASPFGTLAHAGPMSRTVEDAALLMDAITGFDSRDWSALDAPHGSYRAAVTEALTDGSLRGLRIAYAPTLAGAPVDPQIAERVAAVARLLADLGADVEEADPGFSDPVEAYHTLWFAGAAKVVEHLGADQFAQLDAGLQEACREGAAKSALDYLGAVDTRMALGVRMGRFHETYDLLLTPAVPIPAFEAGVEVPAGSGHKRWTGWTPFTYPFNLTQQPASTVPCGVTDAGLPVGAQLVAARHGDELVLRASAVLHAALRGSGVVDTAPVG
ncbi:amidase [Streptomyces sp. NBC_00006]|uniref:amidase n=1 Tax=Streptomyces sp. NBC_00006 TaxID=2975619 RepID=UPI0022552CF0|nr:amidase [Streptomyces sp. NBC_00006]MCX5536944.1 amidase [Streptomyces sp. NBC_00006]